PMAPPSSPTRSSCSATSKWTAVWSAYSPWSRSAAARTRTTCACSTSTMKDSSWVSAWPATKACSAGVPRARPQGQQALRGDERAMTTGSRTSGQEPPLRTAASSQSLVALEADAVKLRAEVAQLQAELATLRGGTLLRNESDVLEANEQLVLAAVRAQAVAENAAALRLVRQTTARARSHDLQQANSQLVASSLHAQEQEAHAHQGPAQALSAMATAAHELRNPLSPIRMAAELLGEARGDLTRFTRLRGIIETEVMHLARLVEDLLDGSRLASGKLRLERTDTGLARVL